MYQSANLCPGITLLVFQSCLVAIVINLCCNIIVGALMLLHWCFTIVVLPLKFQH